MRKVKRKMMGNIWDFGEHESLFSDMAKEGWHLKKIGVFFALFEEGESKDTQYRIDTSSNKSMSAEDKEMFQEAGWQYVSRLGEFNVFSSPTVLRAPELHTDPVEQAYTLQDLAKRIRKGTLSSIVLCAVGIAMVIAFLFVDKTPIRTFVTGNFTLAVSLLGLVSSLFNALQSDFSLRTLRKKLQAGEAINHHAPWKKKSKLPLVISSILIILLSANLVILIVQITLSDTQTLSKESGGLPIVRLSEIEQNPNLIREEEFFEEQLDELNQYRYDWSPIAPLQYESNEQGLVPGQLWQDEDATYSPSLRTEVYRLNFPSLSEKLLSDLVQRHIYEGDVTKLESDVFDNLLIQEEEGSTEIFVSKGKGVMRVAYYGYADIETILQQIEEKMALIEQ